MEALADSTEEVQAAKKNRTVAKGALTRVANTLKKNLVLQAGEKYDFSTMDKYSIAADADKLEKSLHALNQSNEKYGEVAREVLVRNKATDAVMNVLEESIEQYWIDARKDATSVLNLFKYEYSTALNIYLKILKRSTNQQLQQ